MGGMHGRHRHEGIYMGAYTRGCVYTGGIYMGAYCIVGNCSITAAALLHFFSPFIIYFLNIYDIIFYTIVREG